MISKKKSKSFNKNTKNIIFSKIKSRHKCKSLLNLKSNISINKKINKEVIEYKLVPSLNNVKDKTNILKSFQSHIKNQKLYISKDEEYNQCLTSSSKYDLNSKNKNNEINRQEENDNNKEYIIVPKSNSKIRNSKKHNSSKMINKRYILKIENNIDNIFKENSEMKLNISNLNNNTTYNNYKTYRNNYNVDNENENITQKFSFDDICIVSKINSIEGNENINIIEEDDDFLKDCQNDNKENKSNINKYKIIINKLNKEKVELSENLNKICLTNNELKNYNEILKQTIENYIIKSDVKDIIYETSKILNKSPVNLLTEFTKYKTENKKIKKNLLLQQILTNEMKNEIENLKKENENLAKKLNSEKKLPIENNTLNSSNMKNEDCYKTLIETNTDLNKKYLELKNDFAILFQNNENLNKFKEKLIKENEQLKIEINNLKKNEFNKNEFNELKNKADDLESKNMELKMTNERQKNEMENMKEILNIKNNELIKFKNEFEFYKEKEYQNINELLQKKDSEISELKMQINNIEQMANEIYGKIQIKKDMDLSDEIICIEKKENLNLEEKMAKIRNYIDCLINEINRLNQKENNYYKNVLEDNSMNINYNNKEEEDLIILDDEYRHDNDKYDNNKINYNKKEINADNEKTYNYKNVLDNIKEGLSIIKKEENQNFIFNYNKKDDLSDFKYKNNKILSNPIKPKKNNIIFKSFSTKQIKTNNNYIDIFRNKNKIIKTKSDNNKIEINTKDIKSLLINDKEETKTDYIDSRYITVPVKKENRFSSIKAKKLKSKIGISNNNSNYLNEILTKNPKYIQGLQTIESSTRLLNNNFCSINNDNSFNLNEKIKEIKENKRPNFRLYSSKSIKNIQIPKFNLTEKSKNNLANEVLKPSFLKSGFNTTFYNYYNNNQNSSKNNKVIRDSIYKKINFL